MNTANNTEKQIEVGTRLVLTKGCAHNCLDKGARVEVTNIVPMGAEYSNAVKVTFRFLSGFRASLKPVSFFARHINRLSDSEISMNDGDPSHTIKVRRA